MHIYIYNILPVDMNMYIIMFTVRLFHPLGAWPTPGRHAAQVRGLGVVFIKH